MLQTIERVILYSFVTFADYVLITWLASSRRHVHGVDYILKITGKVRTLQSF
jgi:hypothetical protein